ncbi:hypothetical protein [Ferruginibacter sp. SUN106]|uniref:hypothetical protein n=1 Tax=Ferruginibacter sp. SUN106 TaxID=2978348 RepID=UPI003D36C606
MRNLTCLPFLLLITILPGCIQCITGGNLHVRKKYIGNVCGLANGIDIEEIKVDSFKNEVPVTYTKLRSAYLYKQSNNPMRLYFARDCKNVLVWEKNKIVDTLHQPLAFNKNNWYVFYSSDAHMTIFMFVDAKGKRHFKEVEGKSGLVNF